MKKIVDLAHEHMLKRYFGGSKVTSKRSPKYKNVTCCECGRNMDVREIENAPYWCYKCNEEAESIWR